MNNTHTNGTKKFLFVVIYNNSEVIDIIRSGHNPDSDEIRDAIGDVTFDPTQGDYVIRYDPDSIIDLPPKAHV